MAVLQVVGLDEIPKFLEEMGLLPQEIAKIPEAYVANLKQPKQLERISPIGDKAEVPETLKGIGTPKTGNVREWDDQDRQAWAAMTPQRKKGLGGEQPNPGNGTGRGAEGGKAAGRKELNQPGSAWASTRAGQLVDNVSVLPIVFFTCLTSLAPIAEEFEPSGGWFSYLREIFPAEE